MSPSFRATSDVSGCPGREVRADDDGVDARAEVVDVRDGHDAHAVVSQRLERARAPQRLEEVAVTRRVQRRPTVRVAEELAGRVEPERHELVEDERIAEAALGHVCANRRVGREARHQRDRNAPTDFALERRGLYELRLEEAHAVDGGQHGLHDTAEAGRHPAREHDLCDFAATQRVETGVPHVVVPGVAGSREPGEVFVAGRLDRASDQIRLGRQLSGRHPCPERLQEPLVEPEALEDDRRLAIDVHQRALRTMLGSDDS